MTSAIVVGVDGSEANRAAVTYAVERARAAHQPLRLVAVLGDYVSPLPHSTLRKSDDRTWQALRDISDRIHLEHPDLEVHPEVQSGGAVSLLLDRSVGEGELIVGKRGLGTFARLLVGSTSIAVAGRSGVPVVVVPSAWDHAAHATDPIVVGCDPERSNEAPLRYAFTRAKLASAPLRVVYAVDPQPVLTWDPAGDAIYRQMEVRDVAAVKAAVDALRDEYPTVRVETVEDHGYPSDVLLDAAASAQLLVVGRHEAGRSGFRIGSVTRGVLHHAEVPVAVVPATERQS